MTCVMCFSRVRVISYRSAGHAPKQTLIPPGYVGSRLTWLPRWNVRERAGSFFVGNVWIGVEP